MTIEQLENKVKECAQSSYEGFPLISDKEFNLYILTSLN